MTADRTAALEATEELQAAVDLRLDPVVLPLWTARALLSTAKEADRMEDGLQRIKQWADAYPVEMFRPVSDAKLKEANEALKAIGVDMGALHAGWARHIVDGIRDIARAALNPSEGKPQS